MWLGPGGGAPGDYRVGMDGSLCRHPSEKTWAEQPGARCRVVPNLPANSSAKTKVSRAGYIKQVCCRLKFSSRARTGARPVRCPGEQNWRSITLRAHLALADPRSGRFLQRCPLPSTPRWPPLVPILLLNGQWMVIMLVVSFFCVF